jgi:hypothetical protein
LGNIVAVAFAVFGYVNCLYHSLSIFDCEEIF